MKRTMFEAYMQTTTDSVVYSDLNGRYVEVSQRKADNWNTTRRGMIGKTDYDFMSKEEADQAREDSLHVINSLEPIQDRVRRAVRKEEIVWYSLSEYPWINDEGKIIGTISVSRNITDRIEQEQKIIATNQQILDMLKIVSHDLCGPLTNISAIAKRAARGNFGNEENEISLNIPKCVRNTFDDIYKRSVKLGGAVSDYLYKLNNLNEGQYELEKETVDVRIDVIDPVLEELEELIQDNNSVIDSTFGLIPPHCVFVYTNKEQLKVVYRNLIINALKHGGRGCVISFGFENKHDRFVLNVYNNGPAVPEEEVLSLFEPFVQGKNVARGNGLGIGLCTIRNMIRTLGGDMWYETTLSNNPNFIFTVLKK